MKVEIRVTSTEKELNQAQLQRIRRAANMLKANNIEVELIFTPLQVVKEAS